MARALLAKLGSGTVSIVDSEFLLRALSIVAIDLTVAGDNALVIALALRNLPRHQQTVGRVSGTLGAVVLRLAFILGVTWLLTVPLVRVLGGLVLVWIAVRLVRQPPDTTSHGRQPTTLREAIWLIMVADAAMSLDNVLAVAAAAHGDVFLALFGVALSLPIVVWGSGLVAWLMKRYVWIVWIGGGILGYVAGEMIVAEPAVEAWLGGVSMLEMLVPISLALLVTTLGWLWAEPGR